MVTLCTLIFAFSSYSQITSEYQRYKEQYPNSNSVRLSQESTLTIGLDDGKFKITQDISEEDIYLDEGAKNNAKQSLSFSTFYDLESIEASSYVIEGGQYQKFSVSDFKEKDDLDNAFYDDVKSLSFIFPRLGMGAKTKLKYEQTIKNPRFLFAHYFGGFYPIVKNKFTIIVDKDINLLFKEFNTDSIPIKYSKSQNRKSNIYTWELRDMDEFKFETRSPTYKSILPHIIPIISSYKYNDNIIDVGNDVTDLYNWYYTLTQDINRDESSNELIQIVNELTKGKKSELEKVKAIYYWAQENIKYIAFEYALGGFVPREANEVFNKKYGDCKDNASLLYKMLEIAGIQGQLAWIGTRSIPYSYLDVPTPSVDNHMILYYENKGNSYYLDATGRYNPLEIPTSFIQGKEALVSMGKDSFMLKKVPIIKSQKSVYKDSATLELNGNNLKGTSKAQLTGYTKINFFYELEKQDSREKIRDYYKWFFEKGNNSFLIEQFTETNLFKYDEDLTVDYDFNVSNYAKVIGDEIYINLNLNKSIAQLKTEEDREMPLEHNYLDSFQFQNTFIVPEGYEVDYLPENIDISNEYINSSIQYELTDGQILYKHHIEHNSLILDLETQKKVNSLIKKIEQGYKEVVVLKKNN